MKFGTKIFRGLWIGHTYHPVQLGNAENEILRPSVRDSQNLSFRFESFKINGVNLNKLKNKFGLGKPSPNL